MIGSQACDQSPPPPPSHTRRLDHKRVYPAIVFIPLFYLLVRYLPPLALFLLVTTVIFLALWEFYSLSFREHPNRIGLALGCGATSLILISLQWPTNLPLQISLGLAILSILTYPVLWTRDLQEARHTAILLFGVLYIGFTLGHLLSIRKLPDGVFLIFFVVLVTWTGDTGAYYIGKLFGRRPLAPVLSPNKTVEGFLGGVFFACFSAWIAHVWFLPSFTVVDCLMTGSLLTGVGLMGDLSESAFKRQVDVKDSGSLIPGHGGMLDRLDSLLLTAPTFYYYMVFVKG